MEKKLILRGVLVGAVAGLLAFLFARIFAEPLIGQAIAYEGARDAAKEALEQAANGAGAHNQGEAAEVFSRTVQSNIGIGVGIIAFGATMGALFAVAFIVAVGRSGKLPVRAIALLVAAGGFLSLYLVPFLKYPSSPPTVGHDETIRARSGLYLSLVLISLILLVGAVWLGQQLKTRYGNWNASLIAGGAFIVTIGLVMWILPSFGELATNREIYGDFGTETPQAITDAKGNILLPGISADLLFNFRLYAVGAQVILWSAIGLLFAPLAERVLTRQPAGGNRSSDLVSA